MVEIAQDCSLHNSDTPTKLKQLIDSALYHHNEETRQFVTRWEELKRDDNLRLEATSLIVRKAIGANGYELRIACDSTTDLLVWKLCLATALTKFPHPGMYDSYTLERFPRSVSLIMYAEDLEKTLNLVATLIYKTNFATRDIDATIAFPLPILESKNTAMQQLVDSVLEYRRDDANMIIDRWEELKTNPTQRLKAHTFSIHSFSQTLICEGFLNGIALTEHRTTAAEFSWDENDGIELSFGFPSTKDLSLWSSCFVDALIKLEFPETSIKIVECAHNRVYLTMEAKSLRTFLEYLIPLGHRTYFTSADFGDVPSKIMHDSSDFFETNCLKYLSMDPVNVNIIDFNFWLYFVRKVRPEAVIYERLGLANEVQDFLVPLAEIVETIDLYECRRDGTLQRMQISDVMEIVSGGCNRFTIYGSTSTVSLDDAVKLVSFFHHLEKPICLIMPTDLVQISGQSGVYSIATLRRLDPWKNSIIIDHINGF